MTPGAQIRFLRFGGRRVAVRGDRRGATTRRAGVVGQSPRARLGGSDRSGSSGSRSARATRWCATTASASACLTARCADEDLTLDGEVALLRAVLDELAMEKVVLVGGSSGGCAAIAFAARFPERVDRLLLYGAVRRRVVDRLAGGARGDRCHGSLALGARVPRAGRHLPRRSRQRRAGAIRSLSARRRPARRPRRRCWSSATATTSERSWSAYGRRRSWCIVEPIVPFRTPSVGSSRRRSRGRRSSRSRAARISRGPAMPARSRARCDRICRARGPCACWPESRRRPCSPAESARCWRWSRTG